MIIKIMQILINSFSIIMNFPEPIGLQTNTSLEDGNKSEISNWERAS